MDRNANFRIGVEETARLEVVRLLLGLPSRSAALRYLVDAEIHRQAKPWHDQGEKQIAREEDFLEGKCT